MEVQRCGAELNEEPARVNTICRWCHRDTRGLPASVLIDLSVRDYREYAHEACARKSIAANLAAQREEAT